MFAHRDERLFKTVLEICLVLIKFLKFSQIILNINFSSRTSSMGVQQIIESSVEKRTKDTFGPPIGKKIAAFIDDMNMPQVDRYEPPN